MMKMCLCLSVFVSILYLSFYMSLSWSLSSLDDKLSENIWFVWFKTSYGGDKWKCHAWTHTYIHVNIELEFCEMLIEFAMKLFLYIGLHTLWGKLSLFGRKLSLLEGLRMYSFCAFDTACMYAVSNPQKSMHGSSTRTCNHPFGNARILKALFFAHFRWQQGREESIPWEGAVWHSVGLQGKKVGWQGSFLFV